MKSKETALKHLNRNVPVIEENVAVSDALSLVKRVSFDYIENIYIVDDQKRLKGYIKTTQVLSGPPSLNIAGFLETTFPVVHPETNQEKLATLALRHNLSAIPVVDAHQRFLGVVPMQSIISILRKEHIEDIHRIAGISQKISHAGISLTEHVTTKIRHRLPWLMVGLFGSLIATYFMSGFEEVFDRNIALSFFIPGIVYLADAIGTQSETITIRSISLSELPFKKIILNEMSAGLMIGLVFGLIYFPFCLFMFEDIKLAITVSSTILMAGSIATTIGIILPAALQYLKIDPAFGSGPIATVIQDILSIVIYLFIAQALLTQ